MSFSNTFENALLTLLFNNAPVSGVGDAAGLPGSVAAGQFFVALHTADPGESGTQSTAESAYTGYTRVGVARTSPGWTVSGPTVVNTAQIQFPACTGGAATLTHFSIGTDPTGAGTLLLSGPLSAPLAVSAGITPLFAAAALSATLD